MPLQLPTAGSSLTKSSARGRSLSAANTLAMRLSIGAFTLAGFALRAYALDAKDLRGDESFAAVFAAQPLAIIWQSLARSEPHPPLYYVLLHATIGLAGPSTYALRYLSVLFGVLVVPALAQAAWIAAGRRAALLVAVLAAVNPLLYWQAQDARMYAQLAAFTALALSGGVLLVGDPKRRRAGWLAFGIGVVGALLTHFYAALNVAALAFSLLLIAVARRRAGAGNAIHPAIFAVTALLVVSLPLTWYSRQPLLTHPAFAALSMPTLLGTMAATIDGGMSLPRELARLAAVVGIGLPVIGLAGAWHAGRRATVTIVGAGLLLPVLAFVVLELRHPAFQPPYAAVVAPAWLLAVGCLGCWPGRWPAVPAATGAVLLVLAAAALHTYAQQDKDATWRLAAQLVRAQGRPGDAVVTNYPDPGLSWVYGQQDGGPLPVILEPATMPVDDAALNQAMIALGERYQRIWFWTPRQAGWDPRHRAEIWLDRHTIALGNASAGDVQFRLFETPAGFLATAPPLPDLTFGGQLRVRGALPATSQVAPGGTLPVELCFQAVTPPGPEGTPNYTAFVHLERAGTLGGQDDRPPINGLNPTSTWQAGESFLDRYTVRVLPNAAPGDYAIRVGFYSPTTLQRLPLQQPDGTVVGDALTVGEVTVR